MDLLAAELACCEHVAQRINIIPIALRSVLDRMILFDEGKYHGEGFRREMISITLAFELLDGVEDHV